jgi:hypothetical protein
VEGDEALPSASGVSTRRCREEDCARLSLAMRRPKPSYVRSTSSLRPLCEDTWKMRISMKRATRPTKLSRVPPVLLRFHSIQGPYSAETNEVQARAYPLRPPSTIRSICELCLMSSYQRLVDTCARVRVLSPTVHAYDIPHT